MAPLEPWLAEAPAHRQRHGRPLVTLSYAQSLDGSLSRARGETTAISGPESLAITHQLRAAHDAILVGIGTVLADDPQLTVRLVDGADPQVVIVDSRLRLPPESKILSAAQAPWIFFAEDAPADKREALEQAGAQVQAIPSDSNGRLNLDILLTHLADWGINSLMVEGGAGVISSFLAAGLADLAAITIAPLFLGGLNVLEDLSAPGTLPRIRQPQVEIYGEDILVWGRLEPA